MKRILTLFLSLILGISTFSFVGCKQDNNSNDNGNYVPPEQAPVIYDYDYTDGKWAYFLSDDNTYLSILYVGGDVDELTVPTSYNGIPVTTIKTEAFLGVKIGKLTILDNITTLESRSIDSCKINKLVIEYPEEFDHGGFGSTHINLFIPINSPEHFTIEYYTGGGLFNKNLMDKIIIPKNTKTLTYHYLAYVDYLFYDGPFEDFKEVEGTDIHATGEIMVLYKNVYLYSEVEPELNADGTAYDGKYWRYVNNEPVVWEYTPIN